MKKIFLIAFLLFLSGCSLKQKVDGKTAEEWKVKYDELQEKIINDEFSFKKNKECFSYKEEIEEFVSNSVYAGQDKLLEIFYSPKTNSCLFVTTEKPGNERLENVFYLLNDLFNNSVIESAYIAQKGIESSGEYTEWRNLLEKYKN